MRPLLKVSVDGREMTLNKYVNKVIKKLNIPNDLSKKKMPDGNGIVIKSRISWAKIYLSKSELIESVRKGVFKITPAGVEFLENSSLINFSTLPMTTEHRRFLKLKKK